MIESNQIKSIKDNEAQGREHERCSQIIHVPHHKLIGNLRPSKWKTAIVLLTRSFYGAEGISQSEILQIA